jgi:hypothetical protein
MLPWWFVFGAARAEEPLAAPPEPAADVGPATPEQAVAAADGQVAAGEVDLALAALRDATRRWPDARDPWVSLASYQIASGRLDDLAETLAAAPTAHRDALALHRVVGALVAQASGTLPPTHPLRAVVLDEALAPFDARGGADAEFAATVRLVEAVLAKARGDGGPGADAALAARAVALVDRPAASRAAMEAGAAALTMVDRWDAALDAVGRAAKAGADPAAAALLTARLQVLWGLRTTHRRRLEKGSALLSALDDGPGPSPAALAAERDAVSLALAPLPRGAETSAVADRLRARLGALDPAAAADAPWIEALSITLASLSTAADQAEAAVSALRAVDPDRADPVFRLVAALALARQDAEVPAGLFAELARGEDEETRALAGAWLAAGAAAPARSWVPVATGAALVRIGMDRAGPQLAVTLAPTVVMVLSPEE